MAKSKLQGLLFDRGISQRSLARELGVTPMILLLLRAKAGVIPFRARMKADLNPALPTSSP